MPSYEVLIVFAASISLVTACRETPQSPPLPPHASPIPERSTPGKRVENPEPSKPEPETLVKESPAIRYSKPGAVRWAVDIGKPITLIRWSPLAGLVVSAGSEVRNVTSRGEVRFRYIAGDRHLVFASDETEIVWSPSFGRVNQILRGGRQGWSRDWNGELDIDSKGNIYLVDASTVTALGSDGADRWRASPPGIRKLAGPISCGDQILFYGGRGLEGMAIRLTSRGSVAEEIKLERGAVLIGAGSGCEPLIWKNGEIALVDKRGLYIWKKQAPEIPIVKSLESGFVILHSQKDGPALVEALKYDGEAVWRSEIPITGRITGAEIVANEGFDFPVIGLCVDVASPCSRPGGDRGPFNALITSLGRGRFRTLVKHVQGHLNFSSYPGEGFVVASSPDENGIGLTLRDSRGAVVWHVDLPGRLSAGPYVGPSGEVYIGSCAGWQCKEPYLLTAVTGDPTTAENSRAAELRE